MKQRMIMMGGGFAGLRLAKNLSGNKHFEVIIVDRNNCHFFPPYYTRYLLHLSNHPTSAILIGKCFNAGKISGLIWENW